MRSLVQPPSPQNFLTAGINPRRFQERLFTIFFCFRCFHRCQRFPSFTILRSCRISQNHPVHPFHPVQPVQPVQPFWKSILSDLFRIAQLLLSCCLAVAQACIQKVFSSSLGLKVLSVMFHVSIDLSKIKIHDKIKLNQNFISKGRNMPYMPDQCQVQDTWLEATYYMYIPLGWVIICTKWAHKAPILTYLPRHTILVIDSQELYVTVICSPCAHLLHHASSHFFHNTHNMKWILYNKQKRRKITFMFVSLCVTIFQKQDTQSHFEILQDSVRFCKIL